MIKRIDITTLSGWLRSRGGRTMQDIHKDDNGYFVWMMGGRRGLVKIYLEYDFQQQLKYQINAR